MPVNSKQVAAITFDSFTTIVDVHSTIKRALGAYVDDEETVADVASLWRFRAVEYRMVCNAVEPYETYVETTYDALEYALAANGVDLPDADIEDIVSQFHELDIYDDVFENFRLLDEMGYDLYIVSNGTQDLLQSMVSRADITDFVVDTISADDVRTYKPELEFYRHAVEQTGTPAENTVHVATPWYDIYGANNAGMQTIWLNRNDEPWERFDGSPDRILETMDELPPVFE